MNPPNTCQCATRPTLIFPCGGGSNVGELSDRVARYLTRANVGKMYCLAGVGGRVNNIMRNVEAAERLVVIDGCPTGCARQVMLEAGFNQFEYFELSRLGQPKGKSPVSEDRIAAVGGEIARQILRHSTNPEGVVK